MTTRRPDFTPMLVGFTTALRRAGLTVGSGDVLTYCAAATVVDLTDLVDLYWAGRCTLLTRREQVPTYHRTFVSYFLGSWFPRDGLMVDLGLGYYNENIRIKNLDRDALDLNVHFFAISHFEAVLLTRAEFIGFGSGGPTGAYVLLMGHYRL